MRIEWGKEPRDQYPELMVLASKTMQENYSQYGDLLAFDVTYGLLRNVTSSNRRYRVGVFTVSDSNLRLLLAGIAFLSDE